jgi:DNA-binding IclR family transcriptional regulator
MPSPAVVRAARLLSALAARPGEDATLSQLARQLDINKTSCQSVLRALMGEGLVIQGPDLRYRLGSALIPLGEAAKDALRLPELVAPTLERLSGEFGVTALCGVKDRAEIVLAAVREVVDPLGLSVRLGQRLPLRAPFGPVYLAWEQEAEVEQWLARAEPALDGRARDRALATLDQVRRQGVSITVRGDLPSPDRSRAPTVEHPGGAEPSRSWNVLGVAAPLVGSDGSVVCSVAVAAFPDPLDDHEIAHVAGRVTAAAVELSAQVGGVRARSGGHLGDAAPVIAR